MTVHTTAARPEPAAWASRSTVSRVTYPNGCCGMVPTTTWSTETSSVGVVSGGNGDRGSVPRVDVPPQIGQRLKQPQLQVLSATRTRCTITSGREQPRPERLLPILELRVEGETAGQRQGRVLVQQEHQPRQLLLGGRVEFELGVGHGGLITDRRPVTEPDDADVHVRLCNPLLAIRGRPAFPGREVRHVSDGATGSDHRSLGRGDEGIIDRVLTQFRGVTEKTRKRATRRSRSRGPADPSLAHRDIFPSTMYLGHPPWYRASGTKPNTRRGAHYPGAASPPLCR